MKTPFSIYDFFGYLAAGFLLLVALDFSCSGGWLLNDAIGPVHAILWTLLAYVVGHIVAHIASTVVERLFLRKFLGSPEDHLLATQAPSWKAKLFPGTFKALPEETQDRIRARAASHGVPTAGRALFLHCHTIVKHQRATLERLNIFLARYGFCRNISMASALATLVLVLGRYRCPSSAPDLLIWVPSGSVLAIGMLYRYLKFFRHYTKEVLTSYAEATPATRS